MAKSVLPSIFIVGPLAAGKSTIGRLLAKSLNRQFYDSDQQIERLTGASVAWVFDVEGELGFRRREEAVIDELTQLQNIVLATGGGSILSPDIRDCLSNRGYVIYLQVSLKEQIQRTLRDKHRPLIQTPDRSGALERLYYEREPLYHMLADWTILTDSGPSVKVVQEIMQHLSEQFL